jgi:hypothetical protein
MARRLMVTALVVAVTGVVLAATAFACVPVATLQVSPAEASPGQVLTVTGAFYNSNPVTLHWNSLDGRVVGTITPQNRRLEGTVRVPSNAEPGSYTLVATQEREADRTTWGIPSRALVTVVGPGGAPILSSVSGAGADRLPGLLEREPVSVGEFALVALGVAGLALFVAGTAAMMAGRRSDSASVAEKASRVG